MLGAGALGRPRGMLWGGRREEGSGWGTRVCLWWIHFDIWQNQYNIVKFKNKIKKKKKKDIHDSDNHDGVITDLEPDILECEVQWALGSITRTKLVEVMEFQLSYFKS